MATRRFRHYKGNEYEYLGECLHSESLEEMVIYKADGSVVKRFEEVSD